MRGRIFLSALALTTVGSVSVAAAQSAATCSFDAGNAQVNVSVNGLPANLSVTDVAVQVNGAPCGAATAANTNLIRVQGGALDDKVNVSGTLAPGLTAEGDGNEEIEVTYALGSGVDAVVQTLSNIEDDVVIFASASADMGGDGDVDHVYGGTESVALRGRGGNDILDGTLFRRQAYLYGDAGNDTLLGGDQDDKLYGGLGDDVLQSGIGDDVLDGGPGNDAETGGSGNDQFNQGAESNGSDQLLGGAGVDLVYYGLRTAGLVVTLNAQVGADGEVGEGDLIGGDVEQAVGGAGNDSLTGGPGANTLSGGNGNDILSGKGDADVLNGGGGDDTLDGGQGQNTLRGNAGNDTILGNGTEPELFSGGDGDDSITGLADGLVEKVVCGTGTDTVQDTAEDTFVGCEIFN